jgi:hypothetical protein
MPVWRCLAMLAFALTLMLPASAASGRPALSYAVEGNLSGGYLSLRDGPGVQHAELARLVPSSLLQMVGPCVSPDDSGRTRRNWCKVAWGGTVGWVSSCCIRQVAAEDESVELGSGPIKLLS